MSKTVQHQMKFQVVMMTPEWAQELLDKNHPRNRKAKGKRIEQYARDMEQGYWQLTPEPICVDVDGWLTNGQNRLSAVIRANVEVPMCLITGCPRESILGQDQGVSRNVADVAQIAGRPLPHGAGNYASTVRSMFAGLNSGKRMSNAEVLAFADGHRQAIDFSFECFPSPVKGITLASVRAVVARAWYKRNQRNRTREFCTVLLSGLPDNPREDVAAIRLRNWLTDTFLGGKHGRRQGGGMGSVLQGIVYAKTERALKAFHDRENISRIEETKNELFPLQSDEDEVILSFDGTTAE